MTVADGPIAAGGTDQTGVVDSRIFVSGSSSFDPDGGTLSYSWLFTDQPVGSSISLEDANSAEASFVPDFAGFYFVRLVVNDGRLDSEPDILLVQILSDPTGEGSGEGDDNEAPTLNLIGDRTVTEGDTLTFTVSRTDPG